MIAFNFRPDRMREITRALADPEFRDVDRGGVAPIERYATMTRYEDGFPYPVAFAPEHPTTTLPVVVAQEGLHQLHVAETEKYAHVTYFFNGGDEEPCDRERRVLVPSARDVPTYDYKPEMSAPEIAGAFADAWRSDSPTFGVINFANADMVGHTGVIEAAMQGVQTVDRCLGQRDRHRARLRRRVPHHRRPRQCGAHARAGRQPQHRPHDQSGAADRNQTRLDAPRRGDPRRRCAHRAAAADNRAAGWNDRTVVDPNRRRPS